MKKSNEKWLELAIELQSLAQAGLYYTHDDFDRERYVRIREIAAEMLGEGCDLPAEKLKELFFADSGYQTPKVDTRAAIIRDGRILLVQERDGTWSLPGGWCDVGLSVGENTVKEVREEAGLEVVPSLVVAVQERDKHNTPRLAFSVIKVFVLCELIGGEFESNIETQGSGWFPLSDLPLLSDDRNTLEQVELCFAAAADPSWKTQLD